MADQQTQMAQKLAGLQQSMEMESGEIKKIEAEYQKVIQGKRSMTEKKNENEMVLSEF
jgi:hypothetical protein